MIEQAGSIISDATHSDANIIFGSVFDEDMGDEMLITVIATGFGANKVGGKSVAPSSFDNAPFTAQPQAVQEKAPEFISQSTRTASGSLFGEVNPEAVDFASTKFGQSFASIFNNATANPAGTFDFEAAKASAAAQAPVEAPAAPVANVDVIETPAKKSGSIFDDPDEDESDILPVFKGRNIFGNN
ncbi:MAG: hypothetical protein IIW88_08735, partial [Clostridia bacterium]|nr:hypothetical protein [Clostridia bacterium]